jgi:diazepam-binding inhibitor (GABA receptor modulating acyl-CoA-binding protein)
MKRNCFYLKKTQITINNMKLNDNTLSERFDTHCSLVKILPSRPSDDDLLYLYGMYKQAKDGNCNTIEPSRFNAKEHLKWSSWRNNKDIASSVAMAFYISKVNDLFTMQN